MRSKYDPSKYEAPLVETVTKREEVIENIERL